MTNINANLTLDIRGKEESNMNIEKLIHAHVRMQTHYNGLCITIGRIVFLITEVQQDMIDVSLPGSGRSRVK